jgi:ADP-ribose pyrophosphatase YjhB (NUDIX family)
MNFIIASGPVIIENNKVLLNKHGDDNFWKFVGGRVEDFDFGDPTYSLETACKREVKEEMGLEIEIIRPLKPMMVPKPNDKTTQVVLIHYLSKRLGEITPGNDIKEWNWFDINELPENCAPNIQPVIEEYKSQD